MSRLNAEDLPRAIDGLQYHMETGPEKIAELNTFTNAAFEKRRSEAACRWKYFQPVERPHYIGTARELDGGRLVAVHPAILRRLWVRGREVGAFQIGDVAVHEDYRRGIKLYKSFILWNQLRGVLDGVVFGYGGLITEANRTVGKRLVGYQDLMQLETFERRLSLRLAGQRHGGDAGRALGEALSRPFYRAKYRAPQGELEVQRVENFDERFDELWTRLRDRYEAVLVRDRAVLDWRYGQNPSGEFRIFEALRDGQLVGYAVVRLWEKEQAKLATLIDLFDGREGDVAESLIEAATADAARLDCDFLRFAPCPGSTGAETLARLEGFRPAAVPTDHVIFKALAPDMAAYGEAETAEFLSHGEHWYYCQADSDFQE